MAENNQLSDETKNNSTDTSSTDASSAVIGNHENAVVPHKISNHDKLVQTMVMVDGEWINVNDTNDQANMKEDMHKVNKKVVEAQKGIVEAKNTADSAVKYADSAVSASKVNSDAIAAQSSAIIEAKSAMDSATAEIQQLKANAASDVAQIRADVAQVQNEVDTAKAANSASVDKLKSDIGLVQKDLDNVHDSLTKAQSAVEQNQKLINDSVTKINSDIAQSRQDIITAQQANNDLTKQLDTYSKEAQEQGKTIKTIQDNQDGFSITIADVKGDVTKVSDTVDRLSAGLKDAQGNIASVKAQADQLNVTLTDHSKNINQLIATAKELSSTLKDADGRLSKVEQTAKEHSSTLSDLQGNLSQVKQTATDLVTTLKDAQGNIDQIKQDAKGTLEQLSNVQGDITALQKDVGGIKLTIADHDKNIHTLQADSETLKDDMTDAKGNISSLQKTSTSLVSEFRDHDGRLSKVEQTATEHTSELADTKSNIDKVTQKANALQLLLSDAQKNIQNIQLDAKGLHDTLTGQDNQLARLNVTLNNLDSKYSGITGDLQSKQTALSTEQQQTKDMLLNKADKSEVDNVKETVNHVSAEQKTIAGQISQKVSSSEYQTLKDKVNNLRIGGRNLIPNSGTDIVVESKTTDAYPQWDNHLLYSSLQSNTTYTFSVSATNTNGVEQASVRIFKERLEGKYFNKEAAHWYFNADGKRHNFTFTTPNDAIPYDIWLYAGPMGTLQGKNFVTTYHHPQLELGNIESDYSPNPDDTITSIQKNTTAIDENSKAIKLKADATEVNNLKGTVDSHSASINLFSDQLKSMVTESKVNDIINEKGFTTQSTVQSLIDQKAGTINESITNLDAKYKAKDGVNLATKTGNVSLSGGYNSNKNIGYISLDAINDLCGKYMTVSVDVEWSGWKSGNQNRVGYELQINYDDGSTEYDGCWLTPTTANGKQRVTATYKIKNQHVQSLGEGNAYIQINCTSAKVSHLKIERGMVATPWTPAPSDNATVTQLQSVTASIDGLQSAVKNKVDQSQYTQLAGVVQTKVSQSDFNRLNNQVNVQTLDSANIDNMKTTGHYFVRNLAGNPIGGWVYVDVTGNANDRIRQDVYQDSGTKHAFRRWFGTYWTGWSTGAEESEITQLRSDINLRVKSGDLLSQINIAAGHTLIQSNKIYFDADSFVMSPNSKAFIPSAYITNINADKITTGTLDAAKFNVKNFSADNITSGTLNGVVVKTGANDRYFQTSKDNIYWVRKGSMSLVGNDTYLNSANGLNIADEKNIQLTTWSGATVNKDGSITNNSGSYGHPRIVIDCEGKYNPDVPGGETFGGGPGDSEITQWVGNKEYTVLTRNQGFTVHLNDGNNNSKFTIQKDNKVGFYVGGGDDGNEIIIAGVGPIKLQGKYLDDGFNDGMTHTLGNLQVNNLHVRKWLGVDQSKNAIVKTSQGPVTINAYETAEYYFGDIGEGQTSADGIAYIGIEKLFNETVNTTIPYHVFITAYGPGNIWVDQREHNRFIVKSDQPNLKFSWEIKAKRKGYEQTRLQNVNDKLNHMAATS